MKNRYFHLNEKYRLCLIMCIFIGMTVAVYAETRKFKAIVERVVDGDTIVVKKQNFIFSKKYRVRLYGIDAPEIGQNFGEKAKEFCKKISKDKLVEVEVVDIDHYNRLVANVYFKDERMLNIEMLKNGFAWWYHYHAPKEKVFEKWEKFARENHFGIWKRGEQAKAPWLWRRQEKRNKKENKTNY